MCVKKKTIFSSPALDLRISKEKIVVYSKSLNIKISSISKLFFWTSITLEVFASHRGLPPFPHEDMPHPVPDKSHPDYYTSEMFSKSLYPKITQSWVDWEASFQKSSAYQSPQLRWAYSCKCTPTHDLTKYENI